jgi:hypothetical protein
MRVHRIDGELVSGINIKPRLVFGNDEAARAGVKQQSTAGSDLHRRAWALDGKTNWQVQD